MSLLLTGGGVLAANPMHRSAIAHDPRTRRDDEPGRDPLRQQVYDPAGDHQPSRIFARVSPPAAMQGSACASARCPEGLHLRHTVAFFFLIFGTLLLEIFEVPLSMVRIVGGIILRRIGFSLFMPSAAAVSPIADSPADASGM